MIFRQVNTSESALWVVQTHRCLLLKNVQSMRKLPQNKPCTSIDHVTKKKSEIVVINYFPLECSAKTPLHPNFHLHPTFSNLNVGGLQISALLCAMAYQGNCHGSVARLIKPNSEALIRKSSQRSILFDFACKLHALHNWTPKSIYRNHNTKLT